MITYAVSFDLGDNFDQEGFWETFNSLGECKQITNSTWLVRTEKTAKEIRDLLYSVMDASERLMVMTSASPAAWKNTITESKWILEHIGNK